jgi:N-acetylglucosaminyl-diphospho-decaprenol L-rhamnosyltransferase
MTGPPATGSPAPRVVIVIVTYNSRRDLEACLTALRDTPPSTSHQIVVVDNASTDGTPEYVRDAWPRVSLMVAGANLGFAGANNLAIRRTASELVLLLNPDTVVRGDAVDALVRTLDNDPAIAIAGPRIVDGQGRAELSWGAMIAPLAELRQRLLVRGNDRGWRPWVAWVERRTRQTRRVDWVSGACLLVRRTDLEAVGLLDERYFLYEEDVDVCAAVRARGRGVLFTSAAQIVHLRGRSAASAPGAARDAYRRSHLAFYRKHHPGWSPWLVLYLKLRRQLPDTTKQGL